MTSETSLVAALRRLATHPGARGLADDAAVIVPPVGRDLVLTHDMIVESVHYLASDPPGDVAWKLLAVNLSDLAAKGARPIGVLMGYSLRGDPDWDQAFVEGLGRALGHFSVPLLGGDTVSNPGPRALGLTAVGEAARPVPDRRGARAGDELRVTGTIGDAGLGLRIALGEIEGARRLLKRYRLPLPRLMEGQALRARVHAMSDVSDGLLIDAARMAEASGLGVSIDLARVPLSVEFVAAAGEGREARIGAVTAGDDYELLFAVPRDTVTTGTLVGHFAEGAGLSLHERGQAITLPPALGFVHR